MIIQTRKKDFVEKAPNKACPERIARDFAPDPARFGIDIRSRKLVP
jgi:hypothetical protein